MSAFSKVKDSLCKNIPDLPDRDMAHPIYRSTEKDLSAPADESPTVRELIAIPLKDGNCHLFARTGSLHTMRDLLVGTLVPGALGIDLAHAFIRTHDVGIFPPETLKAIEEKKLGCLVLQDNRYDSVEAVRAYYLRDTQGKILDRIMNETKTAPCVPAKQPADSIVALHAEDLNSKGVWAELAEQKRLQEKTSGKSADWEGTRPQNGGDALLHGRKIRRPEVQNLDQITPLFYEASDYGSFLTIWEPVILEGDNLVKLTYEDKHVVREEKPYDLASAELYKLAVPVAGEEVPPFGKILASGQDAFGTFSGGFPGKTPKFLQMMTKENMAQLKERFKQAPSEPQHQVHASAPETRPDAV